MTTKLEESRRSYSELEQVLERAKRESEAEMSALKLTLEEHNASKHGIE